jgi:uncharacterized protein YjbJ (UPF0337 family)
MGLLDRWRRKAELLSGRLKEATGKRTEDAGLETEGRDEQEKSRRTRDERS